MAILTSWGALTTERVQTVNRGHNIHETATSLRVDLKRLLISLASYHILCMLANVQKCTCITTAPELTSWGIR